MEHRSSAAGALIAAPEPKLTIAARLSKQQKMQVFNVKLAQLGRKWTSCFDSQGFVVRLFCWTSSIVENQHFGTNGENAIGT